MDEEQLLSDLEKDLLSISALITALRNWKQYIYRSTEQLDPGNERDWYDVAFGFLLGNGVPVKYLEPKILLAMAVGKVDNYIMKIEGLRKLSNA